MKKNIVCCFFLFQIVLVFAQSKTKWSLGFSVNPTICNTINTASSNDFVGNTNVTYKEYNDSANGKQSYRFNFGATAWFNYSLNQKWDLQTGIGYAEMGFQRNQTNIQFGEKLYPGVGSGKLEEKTSSVRSIDYNYRFQYLHIPVLFNYRFRKSADYKFTFSYTLGAAFDILLKHKITANLLDDFVINDVKTFSIDSTGYNARVLAFNFILGGRIDYKIDKKISIMIQPVLGFYPISITSTPISVYPIYFSINTGLVFDIAK